MPYIGNTPTTQSFISGTDYFSGTGSQTAYTLTRTVNSVNDIEVVINNVVQQPSTAYTLSGTTITFTSAPSSGTNNIYVRYLSTTLQSFTVSNNSVGTAQLTSDLQNRTYGMKNRIINGAMVIDQRNAGASVTPTTGTYTLDRWRAYQNVAGKFTVQQSSTAPTGFTNSSLITSTSAYSASGTDLFLFMQYIEGFNVADLGWGTASAKTITLSFWVRSSLTGTFGGALCNGGEDRNYPFSYTISSANTWEQKSVTIAGDTTGTWNTTNGLGIEVNFGIGAGSTYSGTAGAWASGAKFTATGATSVVGTNGATFYITGVQLEAGTTSSSYDVRSYGTELALCQRYYQKSYDTNVAPGTANTITGAPGIFKTAAIDQSFVMCRLKVDMRTTPTVTTYDYQGVSGKMAGGSYSSLTATAYQQGTSGFNVASGTGNPNYDSYVNYVASAEF